jgi:hypothetical protein
LPDGICIVKLKIPIWVNFGVSCNGRCWCIFWPFGQFYCHLVNFEAIWYILWSLCIGIFPVLVCFTKKIWQPCLAGAGGRQSEFEVRRIRSEQGEFQPLIRIQSLENSIRHYFFLSRSRIEAEVVKTYRRIPFRGGSFNGFQFLWSGYMGARFFAVKYTKTGKNIPNDLKIYQISTK